MVRHRLNRGGDRQLNRALHTIVMIGETWHEPTRRSVARRIAEGKSEREIRRYRKRTVAAGCPPAHPDVLPTTGPGGDGAWRPAPPR